MHETVRQPCTCSATCQPCPACLAWRDKPWRPRRPRTAGRAVEGSRRGELAPREEEDARQCHIGEVSVPWLTL